MKNVLDALSVNKEYINFFGNQECENPLCIPCSFRKLTGCLIYSPYKMRPLLGWPHEAFGDRKIVEAQTDDENFTGKPKLKKHAPGKPLIVYEKKDNK